MVAVLGLLLVIISAVDLFFSTHIIPGPVYYALAVMVTGFGLVATRK